ncbi:hypothetical protein ACWD6O_13740 [Streptomyces californicus]
MALTPLATVADLAARGLTVDPPETAVIGTFLEVASAAVRDAAGCPISQTTSTVTLEGEPDTRLRLPGPPVTAVATVLLEGAPVTDWRLTGGRLWRAAGWATGSGPTDVTVTYTHGLPAVPADIIDLVCRIAAAALISHRSEDDGTGIAAADIRSERIGDYAVTYGDDGLISDMELPDYLRERLAARFGGGAELVRSR